MAADATEFLVTSSRCAQQWSVCLWDYHSESGNALQQYKGGGIALVNTLSQIGNDYLVTAEHGKPLLHIWPVNSQEQVKNVRLVLPESPGALAISPDSSYIAAGIGTKLYIWQICSGKLLSVQEKHLLPVTCLRFSGNADYLVTAAANGTVIMYNFGSLTCFSGHLAQTDMGQIEPLYSRTDHIKAVTDVHVGSFGLKSRFVTVSLDSTCRIYNLLDGQPLLNLIYTEPLTSIIVDNPCWYLFLGTSSGLIHQFSLQNPPRASTFHTTAEANTKSCFMGHKDRITCLDLNITNEILVSGADDFLVIVWNICSRQMLNKIEHKAAITNVKFIMRNENLFVQCFKPHCTLKTLERTINVNTTHFVVSVIQEDDIVFSDSETGSPTAEVKEKLSSLDRELTTANIINKQLYNTMLKFIGKHSNDVD